MLNINQNIGSGKFYKFLYSPILLGDYKSK